MYLVVSVCCFLAAFVLTSTTPSEECTKLILPQMVTCCKNRPQVNQDELEAARECLEKYGPPEPTLTETPSCDFDSCFAKKRGYMSENGVIDKNALKAETALEFENNPLLLDTIEKECINDNITNYGPEYTCDAIKIRYCFQTQIILSCQDLDDSGYCKGLKELVQKCKTEL